MKRKREMVNNLNKRMTEAEAIKKYNTSKGTVGRVRFDMEVLLGKDPEQMKHGVKRQTEDCTRILTFPFRIT